MMEIIFAAIASFIGTNIDDIFLDTIFFAQADTKRQVRLVVLGKYVGVGLLVLVSFLGACFLRSVPELYLRFLGVLPIMLGVKEWLTYRKEDEESEDSLRKRKSLMGSVVLVTCSGSGDNIGIYTPLFAGYEWWQMLVTLAVFAGMIAVWCFLAARMADLPGVKKYLLRYKHVIVPVVFVLLGFYILVG